MVKKKCYNCTQHSDKGICLDYLGYLVRVLLLYNKFLFNSHKLLNSCPNNFNVFCKIKSEKYLSVLIVHCLLGMQTHED